MRPGGPVLIHPAKDYRTAAMFEKVSKKDNLFFVHIKSYGFELLSKLGPMLELD